MVQVRGDNFWGVPHTAGIVSVHSLRYVTVDHTVRFKQSRSYADVCGVCVCAIPFEMVCLLCRQCRVMECLGFWPLSWCGGQGVGGGFLMDGGFSGGCQRLYWEIWSSCHWDGCWLRIRHGCKTFRPCLDGLLSCDGVMTAWRRCGRRNVHVREGETGCVAVIIERYLVFIVTYRKASSGLSDIRFVAVWAG